MRSSRQSETVPKIVPSGGLFPFRSQLDWKRRTRLNTGGTKHQQISLNR